MVPSDTSRLLQSQLVCGLLCACLCARLGLLAFGTDPIKAGNSVSSPGAGIAALFVAGFDAMIMWGGGFLGMLIGAFVIAPLWHRRQSARRGE